MEYRKRRRRRIQAQSSGGAAKTIAALVVIAAIAYVVSASALGSWISQKVIAPAFAAFDNLVTSGTVSAIGANDESALNLKDPDKPLTPSETSELNIPAMECFALQMGVFGDKSNAENEALSLQGRGAGGYVMEDEGKYRVFAAVYKGEDSLKKVREQLKEQGMDSAVYTFSAPNSTLRITAGSEQLAGIKKGFEALSQLVDDMAELTLDFDQQQHTVAKGKEDVKALEEAFIKEEESFLKVAAADNPILEGAKECFSICKQALTELSTYETESFVDFSSKMKYTNISIVHAYAKLLDKVSNI